MTPEPGCYIDGHTGHYADATLLLLAVDFGWELEGVRETALKYFETQGTDEDVADAVYHLSLDAEYWMGDNVILEGHMWGWYDGEFYLWPNESWEEVYG